MEQFLFFVELYQSLCCRLNITISKEEAVRLSAFASGVKSGVETGERHAEMREIWRLLQDNEYLLSSVYLEKDFFPQVVGSCGQYFAVEYLQPAMSGKMAKVCPYFCVEP